MTAKQRTPGYSGVPAATEGTVDRNCVGSAKRETMSLSRRALQPGQRVLIIDDFASRRKRAVWWIWSVS